MERLRAFDRTGQIFSRIMFRSQQVVASGWLMSQLMLSLLANVVGYQDGYHPDREWQLVDRGSGCVGS